MNLDFELPILDCGLGAIRRSWIRPFNPKSKIENPKSPASGAGVLMSAKKAPAKRRSTAVKAEPSGSTQSAAERRAAEAQVSTLIAKFASAHVKLIAATRRTLRKRLPTAHEIMYEYRAWFVISYSPNERGYEGLLALRGRRGRRQAVLQSQSGIAGSREIAAGAQQATGALDRPGGRIHTRTSGGRAPDRRGHRGNPAPFAPAGRGSVVIRSTSAKPRRPA